MTSSTPPSPQIYLVPADPSDGKNAPPRLVCRTGLDSRLFRRMNLVQLKQESGWYLPPDGIEPAEWRIEKTFSQENQQHLSGPLPAGTALPAEARCPSFPGDLSRESLSSLFLLLQQAAASDPGWPGLFPQGLCFIPGNASPGWAILPPSLYRFLAKNSPDPRSSRTALLYSHPDKTGPAAAGYTLAALAYRLLTGEHPWQEYLPPSLAAAPEETAPEEQSGIPESEQDEFLDALRSASPVPAHLKHPPLRESLSQFLQSFLDPQLKAPPLEEWQPRLQAWGVEGASASISPEEQEERLRRGAKISGHGLRRRRRSLFLRRHRVKLTAAALILVPLLILIINPFSSPRTPANEGLSPREVTRLYYECFNTLDEPAMRDIIKKPIGQGDFDVLTNIYITEKVRRGYEGEAGLIRADDWVSRGRPEIPYPLGAFGVAKLEIQKISRQEEKALFQADYQFWAPRSLDADQDYEGPAYHQGQERTDRVTLIRKNERWFVDQIDRESEPLESPEPPRKLQKR